MKNTTYKRCETYSIPMSDIEYIGYFHGANGGNETIKSAFGRLTNEYGRVPDFLINCELFDQKSRKPASDVVDDGNKHRLTGSFGLSFPENARAVFSYNNSINAEDYVGFYPLLVKDGKTALTSTPSGLGGRRGRTAMGVNSAGDVFLALIPDSTGATLAEVANALIFAGATDGGNFDGGGSSQWYSPSGNTYTGRPLRGFVGIWLKNYNTQNKYKEVHAAMSNSPLVDYIKISPNKTPARNHVIDTISIHCVVGQLSVESLGSMFSKPSYKAAPNYGIGSDGRIGMYVEEKDRSWCTSSEANDNRAIRIEVASDTTDPYKVTDAAYKSLINLLVDICSRNPSIGKLKWKADKKLIGQVDKQNMTVHRWFAKKDCPGDYLYSKHYEIANEVNRRLEDMEDENMTQEKFNEMMRGYRKGLQDNDAGNWSKEARDWATNSGLIGGSGTLANGEPNCMWEDLLTREQMATVLYRFAQMIGKA